MSWVRPTIERTMLDIATVISRRGTCLRRQVGCVLTDEMNRILAVGHNGVPPGVLHCTDRPCPGAGAASGQGLNLCEASHAEANALLFCGDTGKVRHVYCTASPCLACVKLLLMTPAEEIVFAEEYPHELAKERWLQAPLKRVETYLQNGMVAGHKPWRRWRRYIDE
jgi:dCMP deaminase